VLVDARAQALFLLNTHNKDQAKSSKQAQTEDKKAMQGAQVLYTHYVTCICMGATYTHSGTLYHQDCVLIATILRLCYYSCS
jgi:hypothetical protein